MAYPIDVIQRLQVMEVMASNEASSLSVWTSLIMHKIDSNVNFGSGSIPV